MNDFVAVGCGVVEISNNSVAEFAMRQKCLSAEERYILRIDSNGKMFLSFLDSAEGVDLVRGMFHAYCAWNLLRVAPPNSHSSQFSEELIIKNSYISVNEKFDKLHQSMISAGWQLHTDAVNLEENRPIRLSV